MNTTDTPFFPDPFSVAVAPLSARGLCFGYGNKNVLRGLDLELRPQEIYALLGGNGAGKSTLLRLALGLHPRSSGEIRVNGFAPWREAAEARRGLAFVPENVVVYEQLSGVENLRYFLHLAGERTSSPEEWLEEAGLPKAAWKQRCETYSKGMRQKLALALAMARNVRLLLLDEPTSGLDPSGIEEFQQALLRIKQGGASVLLVTHDILGAALVADRLGFLEGGTIQRELRAQGEERFDLEVLRGLYLGRVAASGEAVAV